MRYLRRQGVAAHVTVEAYSEPERVRRDLFRKVKNDIALYQRRAGMRRVLWHEVLESVPSLHSHMVAPMPDEDALKQLFERLHGSSYGSNVMATPVSDWNGLTTYLAGEATPQAWAKGGKSFARVPGSHPLGEGGGDRVRMSRDLEAALLRSGRVKQRCRTYASRSLPVAPELPKPVEVAPTVNAVQLPLFEPLAEQRDVEASDLRTFRQVWDVTQAEVSRWIGIKDRSHIANFERGHDGLSPARRRVLRHLMEERKLAA